MNSRTSRLGLALLAAALLAACATVPAPIQAPTSAPSLSLPFLPTLPTSTPTLSPATNTPYFLQPGLVTVDRDYMNRYVCLDGMPLICQCLSRLSQTCDCEC